TILESYPSAEEAIEAFTRKTPA
ncbi:MAG: hypothetical protein H6Q78_370, partial [Candidatus Krumholzibacteriota bacterium]|nr:hypothetical protein [Candidatus Krumholzibacteriota bacterium]